ncbi:MAG: TrkA C-terminal domain-containing protein [Actinomycetes bacterium]|uniref:Unannotated protein n=1 Tax=freshwater metagenome TaxID=449393 RepID=A0A6J6BW61_9ZZZZ
MAWTSAQVLRAVMPADAHVEWTDPTSAYSLVERRVAPLGAGRSVAELEATGVRVCLLTRQGVGHLATPAHLVQEDDVVHVIGTPTAVEAFDRSMQEAVR